MWSQEWESRMPSASEAQWCYLRVKEEQFWGSIGSEKKAEPHISSYSLLVYINTWTTCNFHLCSCTLLWRAPWMLEHMGIFFLVGFLVGLYILPHPFLLHFARHRRTPAQGSEWASHSSALPLPAVLPPGRRIERKAASFLPAGNSHPRKKEES